MVGHLKCNIDTSLVGINACIRDDEGEFTATLTEWFSSITEIDMGESLGLLSSIKWVHGLGFDGMSFDQDAKSIVDSVNKQKPNISDSSAITYECKHLLAPFFRNSQVKFVRR